MTQIPSPKIVPGPKKKTKWAAVFAGIGLNSLLISILVHLFFIGAATVLVVEVFQKKHHDFKEAPPAPQHNEVEHKVEVAKKNSVESAPPDLKRITTTSLSEITLPDPPEISKASDDVPSTISGLEGVQGIGMGAGSGGGTGLSVPGSAGFGAADGVGLVGTFYDLKQTSDDPPKATKITRNGWKAAMLQFCPNFDESVFRQYYKGPDPRVTNGFAIEEQSSENAPVAFGLAGKVQPSLWAVVYRSHLIAPADGEYRFVGFGDDLMYIRLNGVVVADAGWQALSKDNSLRETYPNVWSPMLGSQPSCLLHKGKWFSVSKGDSVSLDVLIGDWGGLCGYFLMIEKKGQQYEMLPDGTPKLPLFQVGATVSLPSRGQNIPPLSQSDEVWMVEKSDSGSPDGL